MVGRAGFISGILPSTLRAAFGCANCSRQFVEQRWFSPSTKLGSIGYGELR